MQVVFLQGDEAAGEYLQPRFLKRLLGGVLGDGGVHVHPAAGQRPQAGVLLYQQDAPVLDDGGARVDLRRLIAGLAQKHIAHSLFRQAAAARKHLRRQFAQAREALKVVRVFGIGQPRLGDELHLHGGLHPCKAVVDVLAPCQQFDQLVRRAQIVRGAGMTRRYALPQSQRAGKARCEGRVHRFRRGADKQRARARRSHLAGGPQRLQLLPRGVPEQFLRIKDERIVSHARPSAAIIAEPRATINVERIKVP